MLEQDGRASYADLGRSVGLSAAGARLRVLRLQACGAVKITALVDPTVWGLGSRAYVGVTVDRDPRSVAADLRLVPGVCSVALVNGRFNLLADALAADTPGLMSVINDGIRAVDGVSHTEAMPVQVPLTGASARVLSEEL
jgi:Lrp/AsnC family transcriptional regulator for asnA, asnC and gidA